MNKAAVPRVNQACLDKLGGAFDRIVSNNFEVIVGDGAGIPEGNALDKLTTDFKVGDSLTEAAAIL